MTRTPRTVLADLYQIIRELYKLEVRGFGRFEAYKRKMQRMTTYEKYRGRFGDSVRKMDKPQLSRSLGTGK